MNDPEWTVLPGLSDYQATLAAMEARVEAIQAGAAPEAIWLLEHPPLYTAGTSAACQDRPTPSHQPRKVAAATTCTTGT